MEGVPNKKDEKIVTPESIILSYEDYMEMHPVVDRSIEQRRDPENEITQFLDLVLKFESEFSLDALHSITELPEKDASNHPLRQPAKIALEPINELLNILKAETSIPTFDHDGLRAKYKHLAQAVGIISRGKVDHTR